MSKRSAKRSRSHDLADLPTAGRWIRYYSLMKALSSNTLGPLIAYVLPGFTTLWGLSYTSETIRSWLGTSSTATPTVGGFLYVTLGSVAAGLTVSTVRWLVIDTIHHWTGIPRPRWDFSRLQENVEAFEVLVDIHYRYYQFNAGMFIAILVAYIARRVWLGFWSSPIGCLDLGFFLLEALFFVGSRDTYRKYVVRGEMLLGRSTHPQGGAQEKQLFKATPDPDIDAPHRHESAEQR